MKRLIAAAALLASACTTMPAATGTQASGADTASQDYADILATVDKFLLAVGNHDDEALDEILITEGVSYIQTIEPDGAGKVQAYTNASMLEPDPDADPFIERYWSPTVQIRGGLAHVWAPYELRDNGQQVHCGIDAFDLIFLNGAWRVANILSTMEPKGCEGYLPASPAMMRPRDGWKETRNE